MFKNVLIFFCLFLLSIVYGESQYHIIYPKPESHNVSRHSRILVRFDAAASASRAVHGDFFQVMSNGNAVRGRTDMASDSKTVIFSPAEPWQPGARVQVRLAPQPTNLASNRTFYFTVAEFEQQPTGLTNTEKNLQKESGTTVAGFAQIMPNGVSVPRDFPHVNVTTHDITGDGYLFVHNIRDKAPYNIIFDNDGSPVWYERWGAGELRRDFTVQENGIITMTSIRDDKKYVGYDQNFNAIDEFVPADGYVHDGHELQVLENGNYLIIGRRNVRFDASRYIPGGRADATVEETTMQEFTPEHELVFNWPALDNLIDGLPYLEIDDPRKKFFRFPHFNAIDVDKDDGHLLVSSRMLSEVTKVDRETGDIIWRLGGHHSDFVFVNDPMNGFNCQHDIRSLGNGLYSVFDNGNYHVPQHSRGVVYKLDTEAMTATLVWQYSLPTDANFSYYMGSMQHLPNGNYLINWAVGELPKATEVTPDGKVVYEMNFKGSYDTYRTFRFPWNGVVDKPRLFVEQDDASTILIFNKFGDKNVDYYKIYAGFEPNPTAVLDTSRATLKRFSSLEDKRRYYFRVKAVDNNGRESSFSNEVNVFVSYLRPGVNMLTNGDFGMGSSFWNFTVTDADAELLTPDGEAKIRIADAGGDYDTIQLWQDNVALIQGRSYRFEFDAYSNTNRSVDAVVEQKVYPWNNYGKINPTALRRGLQHYTYDFQMEDRSDFAARLVFNCGGMPGDVFIDNVSLSIIDNSALLSDLPEPWEHSDIGEPNQAGVAGIKDNKFVVIGGGENIFGSADECHFAFQAVKGDVEFSAHLYSLTQTHAVAKAGLMIRKNLNAGAVNAMVGSTFSNGIFYQHRAVANSSTLNFVKSEVEIPGWFKIVKSGNAVSGYYSNDGETWNFISSAEIELGETFYIGLAVTSHNKDVLCSGYFADIKMREITSSTDKSDKQPLTFMLYPAFPNPFNPKTTISFTVPEASTVKIVVRNIRGELIEKIADDKMKAGFHRLEFDASRYSSGLYFYEIDAKTDSGTRFRDVKKMTVLK